MKKRERERERKEEEPILVLIWFILGSSNILLPILVQGQIKFHASKQI